MAGTLSIVFSHGGDPWQGRGRLNFPDSFVTVERDATNPFEVDVVIAGGAGGSLQSAYDGGETILTDDAQGPVEITAPGGVATTVPLVLRSTDAGLTGPVLVVFHDSATPAPSDVPGTLRVRGRNDAAGEVTYGEWRTVVTDQAAGAEIGSMSLHVMRSGTLARVVQLSATNAAVDAGAVFTNDVAAGANVPWTFAAGNNFAASEIVFRVTDSNVANVLFTVDGAGTAVANVFSGGTANMVVAYQVGGTQVVSARGAAVADAAGGATIDTQARAAINAWLARARTHGLIEP